MDSIQRKSFIITVWIVLALRLLGSAVLWSAFLSVENPVLRIVLLCWCAIMMATAGANFVKGLKFFKILSKINTKTD